MNTTTKCELCSRYGVETLIDSDTCETRTFEGENVKTLYSFPVCDGCAQELDSDTRKPEDR